MRKLVLAVLLNLLVSVGCAGMPIDRPPVASSVRDIKDKTVALVNDEGVIYCAGVWIDQRHVLTADHCVDDVAIGGQIKLSFREDIVGTIDTPPKHTFSGYVSKHGKEVDLALLTFDVPLHSVSKLSATQVAEGDEVFIVGHPSKIPFTFFKGIVSNIIYTFPENGPGPFIQIIAPIWFGNSGGGAFDSNGDLVGICSFIVKAPEESFWVHADVIREFIKRD